MNRIHTHSPLLPSLAIASHAHLLQKPEQEKAVIMDIFKELNSTQGRGELLELIIAARRRTHYLNMKLQSTSLSQQLNHQASAAASASKRHVRDEATSHLAIRTRRTNYTHSFLSLITTQLIVVAPRKKYHYISSVFVPGCCYSPSYTPTHHAIHALYPPA